MDEPPLPPLKDPPPHLILVRGAQLVRVHNVDDPDPRRRRGFTQVVILAWAPLPGGGWAGLCVWLSGWHGPGPRGSRVTGRGRFAWCRILRDRVEAWRPPRPYIQDPDQGWHGQGDPSEVSEAMARAAETLPRHLREKALQPRQT